MNHYLKIAYEEGKRLAEQEHAERLKKEVQKREAAVGWKERSVPPAKLSASPK